MNSSFALLYVLSAVTEASTCFCLHCHFFTSLGSFSHKITKRVTFYQKPMRLLSHSFSTLSQCVPLCVDFVYITLLLRKGNSFYAIMKLGPPIRLFNSKEYSKEEIDHIRQQQRCNCTGTHVILFVFPGLLVICSINQSINFI